MWRTDDTIRSFEYLSHDHLSPDFCQSSSASRLVRCTMANCRHKHTRPPHVIFVVTFSQARCVRCDTAHAVGRTFSFPLASMPWIECWVLPLSLPHTRLSNMIRSPCDETGPDNNNNNITIYKAHNVRKKTESEAPRCRGVEIQSSVMDFDIWCSNL